jgi:outer membrane protein assembly factor BamB
MSAHGPNGPTDTRTGRYVFDTSPPAEKRRLDEQASLWDPLTFRRLDHMGVPDRHRPSVWQRRRGTTASVTVAVLIAAGLVVLLWRSDGGGWAVDSPGRSTDLVSDDDTVCGSDRDSHLFCLDAPTGHELFSTEVADLSHPIEIVDDTVLVSAHSDHALLAYSLDGERKWRTRLEDIVHVDRVAGARGVVAILRGQIPDTEVVGLDLATGEERWRRSLDWAQSIFTDGDRFYMIGRAPDHDPEGRVAGGTLAARDALVAIEPASGADAWRIALRNTADAGRAGHIMWIHDTAGFDDRTAVGLAMSDRLGRRRVVVVDTSTGELRWEVDLTGTTTDPAVGDPSVAHIDGVTVVFIAGELRAYGRDGEELWVADAPGGKAQHGLPRDRLLRAPGVLYFHSDRVSTIDPTTGDIETVIADGMDAAFGAAVEIPGDVVVTDEYLVTVDSCCHRTERIEGRPHDE